MPWLSENGYTPTAAHAATLQKYFRDHPEQLSVPDQYGWLPLHRVAGNLHGRHAVAIVTFCLKAYPDGVMQKNSNGCLPLHVAALQQKGEHGVAMVMLLLAAYSKGAMQKARWGYLPAHCAKENNFQLPASCIAMLWDAAEGKWQPGAEQGATKRD